MFERLLKRGLKAADSKSPDQQDAIKDSVARASYFMGNIQSQFAEGKNRKNAHHAMADLVRGLINHITNIINIANH